MLGREFLALFVWVGILPLEPRDLGVKVARNLAKIREPDRYRQVAPNSKGERNGNR